MFMRGKMMWRHGDGGFVLSKVKLMKNESRFTQIGWGRRFACAAEKERD